MNVWLFLDKNKVPVSILSIIVIISIALLIHNGGSVKTSLFEVISSPKSETPQNSKNNGDAITIIDNNGIIVNDSPNTTVNLAK